MPNLLRSTANVESHAKSESQVLCVEFSQVWVTNEKLTECV